MWYKRLQWFALFRDDDKIDDKTLVQGPNGKWVERDVFRLHYGTRSACCISIQNQEDFDYIRASLLDTTPIMIPGTSRYYGVLIVK